MPRIKLANWYRDHKPGDEIDVDELALKALRRDGLVAEVLVDEDGGTLKPGLAEEAVDDAEPEPVTAAPTPGRRKR